LSLYEHVPHPHIGKRKEQGPVKVKDQLPTDHKNPIIRFNAKFALLCTMGVGTMWCAYLFAGLAFWGLPTALQPNNIGLLFWVSSDFLQLTLLSVIIVGQNIQAAAADKRAQQTYQDAEAVLHEALQIQAHLAAQDEVLSAAAGEAKAGRDDVRAMVTALTALLRDPAKAAAASAALPQPAAPASGKDGAA